jgi:hypothetical protein
MRKRNLKFKKEDFILPNKVGAGFKLLFFDFPNGDILFWFFFIKRHKARADIKEKAEITEVKCPKRKESSNAARLLHEIKRSERLME